MTSGRKRRLMHCLAMTVFVCACIWSPVHAQVVEGIEVPPATTDADEWYTSRTPRGALLRGAAAPGWGQIYNRQYIKLPFLYAAMGGLIYSAITSQQDYRLYRDAYQYKAFQELVDSGELTENPRIGLKGAYDEISAEFGPVSSRPIQTQRNNFRRSRDLSTIGVGLLYGLAMLDAYVSAHLLDFDIGEDLSLRVTPGPTGIGTTLRVPLGHKDR